jgi:hypothetical protein
MIINVFWSETSTISNFFLLPWSRFSNRFSRMLHMIAHWCKATCATRTTENGKTKCFSSITLYFSILLHCIVQWVLQVMFPSACSFVVCWFPLSFTTCFALHGHLQVCRILRIFISKCLRILLPCFLGLLPFFTWSHSLCFQSVGLVKLYYYLLFMLCLVL